MVDRVECKHRLGGIIILIILILDVCDNMTPEHNWLVSVVYII